MVLKCIQNLFVNVHYRFWARANNTKSRHANTLKMQEKNESANRFGMIHFEGDIYSPLLFVLSFCSLISFLSVYIFQVEIERLHIRRYTLILIVLQCLADVVGLCSFFLHLGRKLQKAINNVRAYIIEKENYKIVGAAVAHYCSNQMEGQKMHWSYDTLIARAALCLHIFRCADFILFVCGSAEEQRKKTDPVLIILTHWNCFCVDHHRSLTHLLFFALIIFKYM